MRVLLFASNLYCIFFLGRTYIIYMLENKREMENLTSIIGDREHDELMSLNFELPNHF